LKYNGGKSLYTDGIVRTIGELMPPGGIFWSPFCGSCKVEARVRDCRRYCSDLDSNIVRLLTAVQKGWQPPAPIDENTYNYWKKRKERKHPMVGFVGYGCSFAGKFFGGFARAEGNIAAKARSTLLKQKPFLSGVEFKVRDYRKGCWSDVPPDVIYCDPPYEGTTTVGSKRGKFDSEEFWQWCQEQSKRSIVLVSEYSCPVPEARCLWSKTLMKKLKSKDGVTTKTERLFCLDAKVGGRIGFGFL
jgi:DNA adenine methylase